MLFLVFSFFAILRFVTRATCGEANFKKRKHQKQHFQRQEKNKNHQKQQKRKYFELSFHFPDNSFSYKGSSRVWKREQVRRNFIPGCCRRENDGAIFAYVKRNINIFETHNSLTKLKIAITSQESRKKGKSGAPQSFCVARVCIRRAPQEESQNHSRFQSRC